MANQPKKYKKFVASAATATLVASAIVPVASAATPSFPDIAGTDHEKAIEAIYAAGLISGKANGTFAPNESVTRSQVALMLGRWAEKEGLKVPEDYKTVQRFKDVPLTSDDTLLKYTALVKDYGIFVGSNGNLNGADKIQRQHMAVTLNSAYKAIFGSSLVDLAGDTSSVTVGDLDKVSADYRSQVLALKKLGITSPANFNPTGQVTRGQFATFLNATINTEAPEAKATAVTATNSTTLTVTGTGLKALKAEDITVAGNTVKSVVSTNGNTATVTLGAALAADQTTKVTVKGNSFDVVFKVAAVSTVTVDELTYDDDTAKQFVSFKVNGSTVTAQELITAGYDVQFTAYSSKNATTNVNGIFTSQTTGELKTDLATATGAGTLLTGLNIASIPVSGADVYVKVTVTKGADVITSGLTKVTIKNKDLAADSITNATLLNYGADKNAGGSFTTTDADFEQNSSTLRTGEKAIFSEIKVKAGTKEEKVQTGYTVKSSDPSVVSVVSSTGVLTAEGPGTATITVTYGGATYTKTITVKNEARTATSVSVDKAATTVTAAGTTTVKVTLLDQYGDPIAINTGANVSLQQSDTSKVVGSLASSTDESGEAILTLTGQNNGTGSNVITFRDSANSKIGTTAVTVTVTDNNTLSQYSYKVDDSISTTDVTDVTTAVGVAVSKEQISTDTTLDLLDDKYLKVDLKGLNSAGVEVSNQNVNSSDYNVTVNQSAAGVLDASPVVKANGFLVVKAGSRAGTATITVTNATDANISKTFQVTVEKVGYNVTAATLKTVTDPTYATTLDYSDFLTVTKTVNDPIVSGLTLSKSVAQPIRLALTSQAGAKGDLYIDKNADNVYDANDVKVGSVVITTTGKIADTTFDAIAGVDVVAGDEGTVLFKVLNTAGDVIATKASKVNF